MNGARRSTTRHIPITNLPELIIPPRVRATHEGHVLHVAEPGTLQCAITQSQLSKVKLGSIDSRCVGGAADKGMSTIKKVYLKIQQASLPAFGIEKRKVLSCAAA